MCPTYSLGISPSLRHSEIHLRRVLIEPSRKSSASPLYAGQRLRASAGPPRPPTRGSFSVLRHSRGENSAAIPCSPYFRCTSGPRRTVSPCLPFCTFFKRRLNSSKSSMVGHIQRPYRWPNPIFRPVRWLNSTPKSTGAFIRFDSAVCVDCTRTCDRSTRPPPTSSKPKPNPRRLVKPPIQAFAWALGPRRLHRTPKLE